MPLAVKALSAPAKAIIIRELAKAKDLDLPAKDRPSRVDPTLPAPGTDAFLGETPVEVIGPGRRRGWLYVAWEMEGVPCLGQIPYPPPPPDPAPGPIPGG